MSDFNKGDFTQQGVNGHVRATLRLNEKRYVELDLTTNENARGCTISGNVHDRLNDLDYAIGAAKTIESKTITENGTYNASSDDCDGYNPVTVNVPQPSGNIAITENTAEGTPLDIAQYATATVNVPQGGGIPFLTATIVNNSGYSMTAQGPILKAEYGVNYYQQAIPANSTEIKEYLYVYGDATTYYVPLHFDNLTAGRAIITYSDLVNCTYDEEIGGLKITDITENASATLTLALAPTPGPQ